MRHYCSLWDSRYMPKGLVLYESLLRHSSKDFTLYVLPMDEECTDRLINLKLDKVVVISRIVFEVEMCLDEVKASRTWQEWCWTCASQLCDFLMRIHYIPDLTYLDADLMFFSDPEVIFQEIGDKSIAVIPHRFIPSKKYLEVNGQFNVSWVTFKNDPAGRECLSIWAAQCRERCSATYGCGDQLYLDEWPSRFPNDLHIIQNIGAGLAPWNLANYQLLRWSLPSRTEHFLGVDRVPVVFYHYHEFEERENGTFQLTNYDLRQQDRKLIYGPYLEAYKAAKQQIESAMTAHFPFGLDGI